MSEPAMNRGKRFEPPPLPLLLEGRSEGEAAGRLDFHIKLGNPLGCNELQLVRPRGLQPRAVKAEDRIARRPPGKKPPQRPSPQRQVAFRRFAFDDDRRHARPPVDRQVAGDLQRVWATVRPGYFNLVDLRFFLPPGDFRPAIFLEAMSRAMESVLGKKTFARWIGDVDAQPLAPGDAGLIGLDELPAAVHQMIEDAQAAMPERPWHELERAGRWAAVEHEPDEAADYADQRDLVAGISVVPWMWQNALSAIPFDSARHSRCGERFCYLKMDGASGWDYAKFADREEIEQALDRSLRRGRLGSVVGGGTGLRYSYIELALSDVTRAWREIRAILADGRLPKRTWLLFHDAALSARWLGLYDDTQSPPRRRNG